MKPMVEVVAHEAPDALCRAKALILAHPMGVLEDADFLRQIGLRPDEETNVVHFGPAALSRVAAARRAESSERERLEAIALANHAAQAQTHAAVIELLEARDHADLARRLRHVARTRFGLIGAVVAVESEGAAPVGWRRLVRGQADMILGHGRQARLGHVPTAHGLFTNRDEEVASVALIRLQLWRRSGVLALAAADPDGFADTMAVDLLGFVAKVIERCAGRWPPR